MILRVYTVQNFIDIELKSSFDESELLESIDNGDSVLVESKEGTKFIINNINVVMIEILKKKEEIKDGKEEVELNQS